METPLTKNIVPGKDPPDLAAYEKAGGYRAVHQSLNTLSPEELMAFRCHWWVVSF